MEFTVDAEWITGVLLAGIRVAGFVISSPIFKAIPASGRTALVVVLGYAFAEPVTEADSPTPLLASHWGFSPASSSTSSLWQAA